MTIKSIKTGWTGISAAAGYPQLGDFESIATVTVGSTAQAVIDFNAIPLTYTHLQMRGITRSNRAVTYTNGQFTFNGDTQSNYSYHFLGGNGTTATPSAAASQVRIPGNTVAANSTSNCFSAFVLDILDYQNLNKFKTIRMIDGYDANGSGEIAFWSGNWRKTNAITSIKIALDNTDGFIQYSTFALYGIR